MRKSELRRLGDKSKKNKSLIEDTKIVGCMSCQNTYKGKHVTEYDENGDAICPKCTVPVVIPMDDIKERERKHILNRLYIKYFMS